MNYIDIVPRLEVASDLRMRFGVSLAKIRQRLSGKNDTPTKRIIRPVALIDGDVVCGVGFFHQDGEVHACRPAADDVDFHGLISSVRVPTSVGHSCRERPIEVGTLTPVNAGY